MFYEHIFFEDEEGGNIGFMEPKEGLSSDKEKKLKRYKITETGYDDKIVREVIEKIKEKYTADNYKIIGHNCQDFVEKARKEYNKIEGKKYA